MYSEFDQISTVGMSSDLFMAEKDLKSMEFEFLLRPTQEFSDECRTSAASEDHDDDNDQLRRCHEEEEDGDHQEDKDKHDHDEERENKLEIIKCEELHVIPLTSVLGEFMDEDDDGFRTPTSLDKKIPVIPPCPPAPRKPKSHPSTTQKTTMKRKSSSKNQHHYQIVDVSSEEFESLFPPELLADLDRKIKKARGFIKSSS